MGLETRFAFLFFSFVLAYYWFSIREIYRLRLAELALHNRT